MSISDGRLRQIRDLLPQTPIDGAHGIQYHLRDLLGEGGQGWVFRAGYDEPDGPTIAVKMLRPDVVNDEALARFLREADVLRKLGQAQAPCPNVVRFYDHGILRCVADGETYALPFMVLEYVHGTNLGEILAATPGRGLAPGRVRRLFRQVARALSMVHAAQIIHRDLKPSNLLVASDGGHEIIKVSDFGLVKRFDVDIKGTVALAGASLGYAPPEQFEMGNKRVSARTDLFSFAAVLYEALTSLPAFPGGANESPFHLLARVLSGPRPQLAASIESVAPELFERGDLVTALDAEIARATAADPGERHPSVLAFWEIVEPLLRAAAERSLGGTARMSVQPKPSSTKAPDAPAPARSSLNAPAPSRAETPVSSLGFRVASAAPLAEGARAVSIAPHARTAFALTRAALHRFEGTSWRPLGAPGVDLGGIHGLLATPAGEVVLFGERGALVGVGPDGAVQRWAPADADVTWTAATLHPTEIVLVGESRARRSAVLGFLRPGQPLVKQPLEAQARITAAARLTSGGVLACGEAGELLYVGPGGATTIAWGRTGHLFALAATPDGGAYVVGSGGHALHVTPAREAKLEPVETTRDLVCITLAVGGLVVAGGAAGRLIRRTPKGWARVPLPSAATGTVRAVQVSPTGVIAVLDDGMVVEGGVA